MKYRSFIFSFNTLKIKYRLPKAVFCSVCIVVATEIGIWCLINMGLLQQDNSLQKLLIDNKRIIENDKPPVWIIGNSTLESLNEKVFNSIPHRFVKLIHGGATVEGSAALIEFYLKETLIRPEQVILFIVKDDVNVNGLGAKTSKTYLDLITWKKIFCWNYSYLRSVRHALQIKIMTIWSKIFIPPEKRKEWFLKYSPYRIGKINPKETTQAMMHNYQLNIKGFQHLSEIRDRFGIKSISVVFLPVSGSYIQWHNRLYPQLPYQAIRKKIRNICALYHFAFIDLGDPLSKECYADFIHLNKNCDSISVLIDKKLKIMFH